MEAFLNWLGSPQGMFVLTSVISSFALWANPRKCADTVRGWLGKLIGQEDAERIVAKRERLNAIDALDTLDAYIPETARPLLDPVRAYVVFPEARNLK